MQNIHTQVIIFQVENNEVLQATIESARLLNFDLVNEQALGYNT